MVVPMDHISIGTQRKRACPACGETIMVVAYIRKKSGRARTEPGGRMPMTWIPVGWFCPNPDCRHFVPRFDQPWIGDEIDDPEDSGGIGENG
jgi:hypothetical protein